MTFISESYESSPILCPNVLAGMTSPSVDYILFKLLGGLFIYFRYRAFKREKKNKEKTKTEKTYLMAWRFKLSAVLII